MFLALLACVGVGAGAPQSSEKPSGPSFEVASVRVRPPSPPTGATPYGITISGTHVTISGPLIRLFIEAYGVLAYQIEGMPKWAESADPHFNIEAKVEGDATPSRAHVKEMLQTLLADRFQVRLHRETRQRQILALVVGKDGVKMKESQPEGQSGLTFRGGEVTGSKLPMTYLANFLSNQMKQPVLDKTELKSLYDFYLHWTPDEASPSEQGGPSIYTAVQEQLGLKLVSERGDMEVLVIDHVEKPTEN